MIASLDPELADLIVGVVLAVTSLVSFLFGKRKAQR